MGKDRAAKKGIVPGTEIRMLDGLSELLVPINDVHPDPANPRIVKNLDVLKASLNRFGLRRPIIVNNRDKQIEAGHQTRQALLELGATHVPVIWADDDRIQATAFNIADNRTAEIVADWDQNTLSKLLSEISVENTLDGIGFSDKELKLMIDRYGDQDIKESEESKLDNMYKIIIECETEKEQADVLERLMEEGIKCQALIL